MDILHLAARDRLLQREGVPGAEHDNMTGRGSGLYQQRQQYLSKVRRGGPRDSNQTQLKDQISGEVCSDRAGLRSSWGAKSQNHRITESQNGKGWKGPLWVI